MYEVHILMCWEEVMGMMLAYTWQRAKDKAMVRG